MLLSSEVECNRWRGANDADDHSGASYEPEVVVFCPECAAREFGIGEARRQGTSG